MAPIDARSNGWLHGLQGSWGRVNGAFCSGCRRPQVDSVVYEQGGGTSANGVWYG